LNADYLSLFTQLEDGTGLDINALPIEPRSSLSIPLDIDGSDLNGEFTLSWETEALPEGWEFVLRDNQREEEFDLVELSEINFQISAQKSVPTQSAGEDLKPGHRVMSPKVMKATSSDPRFTVSIISKQAVTNESSSDLPKTVSLDQNYPNPFNPSTVIRYQLPNNNRVNLQVFDMLGREIATLVDEPKSAGHHSVTFNAENLASGIYIYRLKTGSTVITKQFTLIK